MGKTAIYDIHTHGIGGKDTRGGTVEDILYIARVHGERGTDGLILSVYPGPLESMRSDMAVIKRAMESQGTAPAKILGIHLEGPFLNPGRAGALRGEFFLEGSRSILKELIRGFEDIIKTITIAPEIKGGMEVIKEAVSAGITVMMGHSNATYSEAEAGFRAGARGVTHIFNAMRGFHHREPGLAGYALENQDIYIELIGDPYHLHPATINLIMTAKRHDRIIIVSDTVKETAEGPALRSSGRLLGGALPVMESVNYLESLGLSRTSLLKMVSDNPRTLLHL